MNFPHLVQTGSAPPLVETLFKCFVWICALIVFGSVGYAFIEGWSISDGFYMTMITMSTVGFGETNELSPIGRMFTTVLIILSIICMSCWTACITTTFVSGELTGTFSAKRVQNMIRSLQHHTIILGSGSLAIAVIRRLNDSGTQWVVVDDDSQQLKELRQIYPDAMIVEKSPRHEGWLHDSNIQSAGHVVSALDSDFDNLLIAMTVCEQYPEIEVIARSNDPRVARRMKQSGVSHVICPFDLTGHHVAELIDSPEPAESILSV